MGHSLGLMKSIKEGKKFYNATIFDGSDDEGPVNINAFIGKQINEVKDVEESEDIDKTLLKLPAHEVQLAFFPLNNEVETSDYEMNIVFHENGVISRMLVKYEDFSVLQTLKALETTEGKGCNDN